MYRTYRAVTHRYCSTEGSASNRNKIILRFFTQIFYPKRFIGAALRFRYVLQLNSGEPIAMVTELNCGKRIYPVTNRILWPVMAGMALSACGGGPPKSDLTMEQFASCKKAGGSFYKNECQGKTVILTAIVGRHSSDGVNMSVRESCDSSEKVFSVDAQNLDYDYSKENDGRCVQVFAEIGKANFVTPDITVKKTVWKETEEEVSQRLAAEKAKAEETARVKAEEERLKKEAEAALLEENKSNAKWLSDKYSITAGVACRSLVERLAKYDFEWTDGWLETKFPSYLTSTKAPYILTVSGDKIKFQNGFGAWQRQSYYCDYDVKNGQALQAYVR